MSIFNALFRTKKGLILLFSVLFAVIVSLSLCYIFLWRNVTIYYYDENGSLLDSKTVRINTTTDPVIIDSTDDKIFIGWFTNPDDWSSYYLFNTGAKNTCKLYPKYLKADDSDFTTDQQAIIDNYITPFESVPQINIQTTGDPNVMKPDYVTGTFSLDCSDDQYNLTSVTIDKMRLRGRASLNYPKKSYKIKFSSKNVNIFGNTGNKNWALIANYVDGSQMRNYFAYLLALQMSGLDFSPKSYFVNVNLNGENQGLYLLVETIEASPARVDLKQNPTAENFDTGFIIELTNWSSYDGVENVDYILADNKRYDLQYPQIDDDGIDTAKYGSILDYIKNYIHQVNVAIDNKDYESFLNLCDEDSFIDFMLVQEFMKNLDAGRASVYLYKSPNGKLCMGPVWDFDNSAGSDCLTHLYYPQKEYLPETELFWYKNLLSIEQFKEKYHSRYTSEMKVQIDWMIKAMDKIFYYIYPSLKQNCQIWNLEESLKVDGRSTIQNLTTVEMQYGFLKYWLTERNAWLTSYYS